MAVTAIDDVWWRREVRFCTHSLVAISAFGQYRSKNRVTRRALMPDRTRTLKRYQIDTAS
jgi:hypothetical protein